MDDARITYALHPDATLEGELNALAAVYAYLLKNRKAAEPAREPDSCNDAARVRNTEGVSHVEQRPDRPSEIDHQRLLSPIHESAPKPGLSIEACLGRNIGRAPTA